MGKRQLKRVLFVIEIQCKGGLIRTGSRSGQVLVRFVSSVLINTDGTNLSDTCPEAGPNLVRDLFALFSIIYSLHAMFFPGGVAGNKARTEAIRI